MSFDAPPPPPPGWTLEDGPGRAALLPPPPKRPTTSNPIALTLPAKGSGCGGAALVLVVIGAVIAGVVGIVTNAVRSGADGGDRVPGPALSLGSEERFEIGADDTAVHPLDLGEGGVTVTVTSLDDDFDPVLRIVDADGTVVGENDDADGTDSRLSFTLGTTTHFDAEVHEFSGDAGSYVIAVRGGATEPTLDPLDPTAGDRIDAEPLVLGEAVDRHLGLEDTAVHPLDGFEGRVAITVNGFDGFDPVVQVLDAAGDVVAENDDFDGLDSLVTFVLSPSDQFEVEVREFSGDAGFYSVLLQRGDGEHGAPPVVGEALERGRAVEGDVGREQAALHDLTGDGGAVVVTVEGQLGFDPVVRVITGTGEELAENDDTDGRSSRVELTVPSGQTVTVEVTGYDGQPGRYRVLVT